MMLSGALSACSNETVVLSKKEDQSQNKQNYQSDNEKQALLTEGKEKKDTVWLKEKAHYQFEAREGASVYSVFLFAEDEEKSLVGKEQDIKGHYSVYIAEKDSTVAYKQNVLDDVGAFTFHSSSEQAYPLNIGNETIIVILQSNGEENSKPYLLAIKEGEIKMIQTEKTLPNMFGTEMKAINQKYLQTAHFQENNEWKFITWEYDKESMKLMKLDETNLEQDIETENQGASWYKLWSEKKENYFPFSNLKLSGDAIEKAKQGIPLGSPYPIGTNISTIKKSDPNFMKEGLHEGVPYVMYPEITYYYNQPTSIVSAVSIPGERLKTSLDEVKKLFGKPEQDEYLEENGEKRVVYLADKYTIEIIANEDGKVKRIYLRKK